MKSNKHIKPTDIIFAVVIVAAAIVVFVCFFVLPEGNSVVITDHGQPVTELDLNVNQEYVVEGKYINRIVINNKEVSVEESSCPNQICVRQGKIRHAGESIICAPNGIVVAIKGKDGSLDAITR